MGRNRHVKRRTVIAAASLLLGLGLLAGCGQKKEAEVTQTSVSQISQEEAWKLIREKADEIAVVDVRTQEEFAEGHIPRAICIPNETIGDQMPSELADPDQIILVYCRSGRRSQEASAKLAALGYKDVRDFGGIQTWAYDIEK